MLIFIKFILTFEIDEELNILKKGFILKPKKH